MHKLLFKNILKIQISSSYYYLFTFSIIHIFKMTIIPQVQSVKDYSIKRDALTYERADHLGCKRSTRQSFEIVLNKKKMENPSFYFKILRNCLIARLQIRQKASVLVYIKCELVDFDQMT
jgi:hypothetical protein